MLLQHPLRTPVSVTRTFLIRDPIYYLGVHYANDIVRRWPYVTHLADIIAPGDGQAMFVPIYDRYRGYYFMWRGPRGWWMGIAHAASTVITPGVWVPVSQGQILGYADNTGASLGDHAHIDWLNTAKISGEAVWKPALQGYAHDVLKYIGTDIGWAPVPEEDELTPEDRKWIAEEISRQLADVKASVNWMSDEVILSYPQGKGQPLKVIKMATKSLLSGQAQAKEVNRAKWDMGEGNFDATDTPLNAVRTELAIAAKNWGVGSDDIKKIIDGVVAALKETP